MRSPKIQIILADDDQDDCLLIEDALTELPLDFQLMIVHDGDSLINRLHALHDSELPDVLYLDLNMPRKGGLECLHEIKASDKLKSLPVVICSTSMEEEIADTVYKQGACFYIKKPTDFTHLKEVLHLSINYIRNHAWERPLRENFVLTGDFNKSII
ncbi:CheY chemotaxis protein or a CheY-like REC (receiver) domain [Chitinophaga jiangningensis]|uniref:CheY chemotaxis protein or a CheY-like REC (Receiver) domain n=1 Tax=Chitinophaga jiangningensis TaxID=1419482 RepID=A0A1M6YTA2_9BACT|nr:response regulator [Chitinophaga jiangningensis]SHL21313.1 CheY chemotaxis protein or a CheY-like REC (receiver) domain [Chitinophaga jiangningensis]